MQHAIHWFEIFVTDLDRAARFYEKTLDLSLKREIFFGKPFGVFPREEGGITGALVYDPAKKPSEDGTLIYLPVKDIDAALAYYSKVIVLAAVYAQEVMGFQTKDTIILIMVVNVTAAIGAFLCGHLQDHIGSKRCIAITLLIWIAAIVCAYFATDEWLFWVAANLIGTSNDVKGSIDQNSQIALQHAQTTNELIGVTKITDADVVALLRELKELRSLSLNGCYRVTDGVIDAIVAAPSLERFDATALAWMDRAVEGRMAKAKPGLAIQH